MFGFALKRVRLVGHDVRDAEVHFTRGLNVIAGPSDTGKTYIFQCINFAMGSSKEPKYIKEAGRYTTIFLDLESNEDSRTHTLERSLHGADVRLTTDGQPTRVLKAKHSAENPNTVSGFLLELSGLAGKVIRTKKLGTTRPLSFRDVARLALVDELAVQSEDSPIYSGQRQSRTAEEAVFRLLLTGIDDSSVIAGEDAALARVRQSGRNEAIEVLLMRLRDQIGTADIKGDIQEKQQQLSRIEATVESASAELQLQQQSTSVVEEQRRTAWSRLRQVESKEDVLTELQKRFGLLREQYQSDLRRLAAISEAGIRLGEMKEGRCPVCGALAEHHAPEHRREATIPADVAQACRAEATKTQQLLHDLQQTLESNATEIQKLSEERAQRKTELDAAGHEIQTLLQPRLQQTVLRLREGQVQRERVRRELELLQREEELKQLLVLPVKSPRTRGAAEATVATANSGSTEMFSKVAESIIRSWKSDGLNAKPVFAAKRSPATTRPRRANAAKTFPADARCPRIRFLCNMSL